MAVDLSVLRADLAGETDSLVEVLHTLEPAQWSLPTPAAGWTIADQVSHLAYFDDAAALAATDEEQFRIRADALTAHGDHFTEQIARVHRGRPGSELLDWLVTARASLLTTFSHVDPSAKLPWFGPPMSPASSLTARLMETWAHGLDIRDAVRRPPVAGARLRHIAHLGYATIAWSFIVHERPAPDVAIRLELTDPDDRIWCWGPADAADRVSGPALDFCLLVTQRRHPDDLRLTVTGPVAHEYLTIAQAFAGPPGTGRSANRAQQIRPQPTRPPSPPRTEVSRFGPRT